MLSMLTQVLGGCYKGGLRYRDRVMSSVLER